jgi:hypothetical protein
VKGQPKTDKQLRDENAQPVLPRGVYSFEVVKAEEGLSKKKQEMTTIVVKVFGEGEVSTLVTDFLSYEFMAFKLKHFCDITGLALEYGSGDFAGSMCLGRVGKVKVGITPEKPYTKDDGTTGTYPEKNKIDDYVVGDGSHEEDPDLPF